MRRRMISLCTVLGLFFLFVQSQATCPEQPADAGVCDTLYVEVYPGDDTCSSESSGPFFVRVPIYVTHDIVSLEDSLVNFVIPLCYNVQEFGEVEYCNLISWWNTPDFMADFYPSVEENRSIFRHLPSMQDPQIINPIVEEGYIVPCPFPWEEYINLTLDGTSHFWLNIMFDPCHQRWLEGSKTLLATMTFNVMLEDSMVLCIDSCLWPTSKHLSFMNSLGQTYVPRHNLPYCKKIIREPGPSFVQCPANENRSQNGSGLASSSFEVEMSPWGGDITGVSADFTGSGLSNLSVVYTVYPPAERVEGYITYDVIDHCSSGGTIELTATDVNGRKGSCQFLVSLSNDAPVLSFGDTTYAIAGQTRSILISGTDPNGDEVGTSFNGLWYEADSLLPPINPPSYSEGNPGLFSWTPAETEVGSWVSSFTATDICGGEGTKEMIILVGPLYCGDFTGEGILNVGDVVSGLNYLFKDQESPHPLCRGDVNCDGVVNIADIIRLLNFLFKYGSAPCFNCCTGGL